MKRITWKIGGEAGFGIMISGATLSKVLTHAGLFTVEISEYPSLIRGGHNIVAITISDEALFAPFKPVDILVALNSQTIDYHIAEMTSTGVILYDGDKYTLDPKYEKSKSNFLSVPFLRLASEVGGDMIMRNTVALGATLSLLGIPLNLLTDILTSQFSRKGEQIVKLNVGAAKAGYDFVLKNYADKVTPFSLSQKKVKKMTVTGSDGVGLGALAAGMQFFAAYPMTPINSLLAFMAAIQEKVGIVYKQPEDEIAGINMTIGASFAGVRAMTATSGGGFSLMVEGTSLAGMLEQPIVIVMGMRPGPATGLPTWTGQADLHFVLNAGQGEFPRLVLAPGDPQEAFYLTTEAFNLADRYQTPTFVLVDKYLFESRFTTDMFDVKSVRIDRGKLLTLEDQNKMTDFARYQLTQDGISPRGIPGRKGGVFRSNSDEHNEHGYSDEEAQNTHNMIAKRMKKQEVADAHVPDPTIYGDTDADITLVGWGSTKGAILEGMKELKIQNPKSKIQYLHLNYINPFPTQAVEKILTSAKKVIDIEGNHNAQMAQYIRMKTGIEIINKILKFDGRPFYPEDIVEGVKKYV